MRSSEVRRKYLEFFKNRRHKEIPSASLIPENDPTTLFTSSGMQPLVPYLLGEKHPEGKRLVNSQKCFRAQDIDEIGDNRHTTFFEMLGNWSLGDYFKKEQLTWFFEFLTHELGLNPRKLYVTVFEGDKSVPKDTKSIEIWKELFSQVGIDANPADAKALAGKEDARIFAYPASKNWWSRAGEPDKMPPHEPGGPDSEVFYDFGIELKLHEKSAFKNQPCHPNCNCGRFLEIGNSVFMQYQKQDDDTLAELQQKNVDFGGGLERLVAATENTPDIFMIDLFSDIIKTIEEYSDKKYSEAENRPAIQVIADHLKAATFLMTNGVVPSNKTQGYILRRLLRRAAVKMHSLKGGLTPIPGFQTICESVFRTYEGTSYFDFERDKSVVKKIIQEEMGRFSISLDKGMKEFKKASGDQLTALFAFNLYQTYGFPFEITEELYSQKRKILDRAEFNVIYKKHQDLSRTVAAKMFKGGLADHSEQVIKLHTATHLLHQALRAILGTHVIQKGSNITGERLRFDFYHPTKLTAEEIKKIESLVKKQIKKDLPVSYKIMTYDEAIKESALAFFGERYPEKVKVYSIGSFSKEICGGPHVDHTAVIGKFKITKDESLGSGTRRIYALAS